MQRGAIIVFMRRDDIWKEAIPELRKYKHAFQVKNVRTPAISPGNCRNRDYEKVVAAIAKAEGKR
jgi:hypothetical protein